MRVYFARLAVENFVGYHTGLPSVSYYSRDVSARMEDPLRRETYSRSVTNYKHDSAIRNKASSSFARFSVADSLVAVCRRRVSKDEPSTPRLCVACERTYVYVGMTYEP